MANRAGSCPGHLPDRRHQHRGFTGTGTFIVRLLQSGLIKPHDLARKYATELHANEILLLAYYIAAVNIETTYADATGQSEAFPGLILTDTFQSWEPDDRPDLNVFPENNKRLEDLKQLPITVIVGNPPYSVGQESANDNMANDKYPALDDAIRQTYAARASKSSIRGLYDSYVRAIKWASLRVGDRGVVAYVTNGGFLTASSADGLRKSLIDEFAAIHVFNLRGNRRNAGAEGRPIFEAYAKSAGGSIAGITIIVLIKDTSRPGPAVLRYAQVSDYTTAQEKIAEVVAAGSVLGTASTTIEPNEHGDWLGQRRAEFAEWLPLSDGVAPSVFELTSKGLTTNRDVWVYGYSRTAVAENVRRLVSTYNEALDEGLALDAAPRDPRRIAWSRRLQSRYGKRERLAIDPGSIRVAQYRPFSKSFAYFNASLNEDRRRLPWLFPTPSHANIGFLLTGVSSHYEFGVIAVDSIPDLHLLDTGQLFTRWRYEQVEGTGMIDFGDHGEVVDGYRKIDNITDEALKAFQAAYPMTEVTKDDIFFYAYGLLHSPVYRTTYAADLKKMLPRLPLVKDFGSYVEAGRELFDLHLNYETAAPYPLDGLGVEPVGDPYDFFSVGDRKMSFGKATAEQKAAGEKIDRTTVNFNNRITLRGIPEEAHRYTLGSRSAVEWIIERYYVKTDKNSAITNDPNEWSREVGEPMYILDLLARVVTVSVETTKIVDGLPPLEVDG